MVAATILNSTKSGILGYSKPNHHMVNVYQCTKFHENILIVD